MNLTTTWITSDFIHLRPKCLRLTISDHCVPLQSLTIRLRYIFNQHLTKYTLSIRSDSVSADQGPKHMIRKSPIVEPLLLSSALWPGYTSEPVHAGIDSSRLQPFMDGNTTGMMWLWASNQLKYFINYLKLFQHQRRRRLDTNLCSCSLHHGWWQQNFYDWPQTLDTEL